MPEFAGLIDQFPCFGLFALLVLGTIGFPIPEDSVLILCGVLISRGTVQPVPALLAVYIGMLLTDFGVYAAGRKYGRAVVSMRFFRRIISPERLALLEEKMRKWWVPVLIAGRQVVGLRSQVFIAAGVMRVSPAKFVATDAATAPFTMLIMVGAGFLGGRSLRFVRQDLVQSMQTGALFLFGLAAVLLVIRTVRQRVRRHERTALEPQDRG